LICLYFRDRMYFIKIKFWNQITLKKQRIQESSSFSLLRSLTDTVDVLSKKLPETKYCIRLAWCSSKIMFEEGVFLPLCICVYVCTFVCIFYVWDMYCFNFPATQAVNYSRFQRCQKINRKSNWWLCANIAKMISDKIRLLTFF
jgi:hypothetical protein